MSNRNLKRCSPSTLAATFELIHRQVSLQYSETSFHRCILRLIDCCNNGGCEFATEMVAGIRSLSRPLSRAINSDRSRLFGSAIKLVHALLAGLGPSFEPLTAVFMPTLLRLCAQTSKVLTDPAKECILAIIRGTKSPSLLPLLAEWLHHKSSSLRLVVSEGVLVFLNCVNPPDIAKDIHAGFLEDIVKLTTRDAKTDIRRASSKIFGAYKALFPGRVESFITPLSPVTKRHLAERGTATVRTTSQALPCDRHAIRRVRPVDPLLAQKIKHSEGRNHPLSSQHQRDVRVAKPTIASKETSSAREASFTLSELQGSPIQSQNQQRVSQRVGSMYMGPTNSSNIETARAIQKPSPPRAKFPVAPKTHSTTATIKSSSQIKPLPVAKAEDRATRDTSFRVGWAPSHGTTTTEVRTFSQASCRGAFVPRRSEQARGQDSEKLAFEGRPTSKGQRPVVKALLGGISKAPLPPSPTTYSAAPPPSSRVCSFRQACQSEATAVSDRPPVQVAGIKDVRRPCIDVTLSRCAVIVEDPTTTAPKTSPVWPAHREDLFGSSDDGYAPSSVSVRLRRVPVIPPRILNYRRASIADTPSPYGVQAQESPSIITAKPPRDNYRETLFTPSGKHVRPFQLPPSKIPPMNPPVFELPPRKPFEWKPFECLPSTELPVYKPFETRQPLPSWPSSAPPLPALLRELLERHPPPCIETFRMEI